MAQQNFNLGATPNDGTGDNYRTAFTKAQSNFDELFATNIYTKRVLVNGLSDLPTAAAGVITLAASTLYLFANDVDFGSDRLVFSDRAVISGVESLLIELTYIGTGDFFTMSNTTNRVSNMTITAPNGRIFNWTSTAGLELRVMDVQCSSAKFGVFNGSNSLLRCTNVSPTVTNDGLEFIGSWASFLWEVSGASVQGGSFFDLGTATFNSVLIGKTLATMSAGTTFLSGLTGSGNVSAGGLATVLLTRIGGAGSPLSGISVSDALWEFFHNDEIADTRPDALLTIQGNTTETVISAVDTPALVAGTWVIESTSQINGTTAGRTTYEGGKDATLPITYSLSLEPAAGSNISMSVYVAVNGVVVANSRRRGTTSSGQPVSVTLPWQSVLANGDYHEVFVENNDTSANILVSSGISRTN